MTAAFVPNQNVDNAIVVEAPGHVFAAGTEPWLGKYGVLNCLRLCSLSACQANGWITVQGFDRMISFTHIISDKVNWIWKRIMATTTTAIRSNQPYRILNNIKALVHWCRSQHAMESDLNSRLFTVAKMSMCREELETEEDSQHETSINKPEKFKLINWIQWSK